MYFLEEGFTSNHPAFTKIVDDVYLECVRPTYKRAGGRVERRAKDNLGRLLANICIACLYPRDKDGHTWVYYSRTESNYTGPGPLSFSTLIGHVVEGLSHKYLHRKDTSRNAYAGPNESIERSRLAPTPELESLLAGITRNMIVNDCEVVVCRLRIGKKSDPASYVRSVDIPENRGARRDARRTRELLAPVNDLPQDRFVGLFVSDEVYEEETSSSGPVVFERNRLCRVFSDVDPSASSLCYNGRLERVWWQNISRELRRDSIWIEDDFGVEIDYTSMELAVAYAKQGVCLKDVMGDPYKLKVCEHIPEMRSVLKKILLVMLNGGRSKGMLDALLEQENKSRRRDGLPILTTADEEVLLPEGAPGGVGLLADLLWDKHHVLDRKMSRRDGLERMRDESEIALKIVSDLAEEGIVVLPIHDSFVVKREYQETLRAKMIDAFEQRLDVSPPAPTIESKRYRDEERLYPWNVRESTHTVFCEHWRARSRFDAEFETARRKHSKPGAQ